MAEVPYGVPQRPLADSLPFFEQTGAWVLPVLDGKRFAGLLSKSTIFDHYRRELAVQTQG